MTTTASSEDGLEDLKIKASKVSSVPKIEDVQPLPDGTMQDVIGTESCGHCKTRYRWTIYWSDGEYIIAHRRANCNCEETFRRYHAGIAKSLLTPEARMSTFENFKRELQPEAYQTALDYARNFRANAEAGKGLIFSGVPGLGKSHLAYAICNYVLKTHGVFVVMVSEPELFYYAGKQGFDFDPYIDCGLLVIDDMGKKDPTPYAMEKLFMIVNARVRHYRPIIVTTQYNSSELIKIHGGDTAIIERLAFRSKIVKMEGQSYRMKIIKEEQR